MRLPAVAGGLLGVLSCVCWPARGEDLRIGLAAPATSMDPHFYSASPNISVAMHVFDRLTHRSPDARVIPWLAESWRLVDDVTWEFKLRSGVTFHDGGRLTPDDIAFTGRMGSKRAQ